MEKMISVCGIDCARCDYINDGCSGCNVAKGKVFWAADESADGICPMYACVEKQGVSNCGHCEENLPCGKWKDLREPGITDEQHAINMATRDFNLRELNGIIFGDEDDE